MAKKLFLQPGAFPDQKDSSWKKQAGGTMHQEESGRFESGGMAQNIHPRRDTDSKAGLLTVNRWIFQQVHIRCARGATRDGGRKKIR
jgi:hypothetical protein